MMNSDIDFDVARIVFGVDPELCRCGVPFFSENENDAARVNSEMAFRKDGTKKRYDEELERIATKNGWKIKPEFSGLSTLLMVLCPDDICRAALTACLGYNYEEHSSSL